MGDYEKKQAASLKQIVYEDLKHKIVTCEILPGAQLTEEMLCDMLNASRTPVRDAVSRLEQEQLVTIYAKKGIYVNHVSLANVCELFEARLRIEPYAVQYYGNRIRDDVYATCIVDFKNAGPQDANIHLKDDEFHQMFINATENRYLIRFYTIVKDQVMRYRVLSAMSERLAYSQVEHLEVAQQCLRGNWRQAAQAMRMHIENSKISIINYTQNENRDAKNIFVTAQTDDLPNE